MKLKRFGWTYKDEKARNLYGSYEWKKQLIRSLLSSSNYKYIYRLYFNKVFRKFPKQSSLGFYSLIV